MLDAINAERAQNNLPPLTINDKLNTSAQKYSEYMSKNNYFDHVTPDGQTPSNRITAEGYTWYMDGENIAEGQVSVSEVMTDWMNSPEHRTNILRTGFTDVGIGFSNNYWTQDFGSPTPPPSN